jgi:DNA-directed RNA polymerase specialized sigma24 family protein
MKRSTSLTPLSDDDDAEEYDVADDSPIAEAALDELQQLHLLRLGMDRLDARCRDLLLLVFRDDDDALPYDEVARRMGMPVGSIGPTRSRCLSKLRGLVG